MLKKIALIVILLAILVFNSLRFWKLDTIPNGYHVDEVGSAVTLQCYAQSGCDAELKPWPLFGFMEYGQDKPPTYIYPGILWVKAFGSTVPSLRAYSVFVLLIGIVGLFFLSDLLIGKSFALIVVLAATCSPWAWVVTRVALESYFSPVFMIWGLYFFWRSNAWWDWTLAAFLFICAMYAYPPARMQIPLLIITLGIYDWGRRSIRWPSVISAVSVFILSLIPMVMGYKAGLLSRRFDEISISNKLYLQSLGKAGTPWDIFSIFIHNYFLHLSADFLFFTGDPSYVHSTRHLGLFSWFDIAALLIFVIFVILAIINLRHVEPPIKTFGGKLREGSLKEQPVINPIIKNSRLLLFLAANFFIGIIPAALTNQELPHALRICASWPFMMLFTGLMWYSAVQCLNFLWPMLALVGILSSSVLTYQYFTIYPQESKGMFDYWVKDTAEKLKTPEDWQQFMLYFHKRNYHIRYFLVHRLGWTCKQANDTWWQMYYYLKPRGLF